MTLPTVEPTPDPGAESGAEPFATEAGAASAHLPGGPASRRWRTLDRLVVVAFVAGLLVPGALLLSGRRPAEIENRPLRTLPALSIEAVIDGSWTPGVDAFLADNVAVRPYAVRLRGEAEWLSGGTGNPAVIRGRPGWLFTVGEFQPDCRFTAGQLATSLGAASAAFRASGQAFRILAVPDKHAVYPEQVAANPFPPSCAEVGRATLRAGLATLGPEAVDGWAVLDAARAARLDGPLLYFPLDSHWTPTGAAGAIASLIGSIDPEAVGAIGLAAGGRSASRDDLANQMGIRRGGTVPGVVAGPGITVTRTTLPVPVTLRNARTVFRTTATGSDHLIPGRTVIVYDSFFGIDVDLVAPFFADATWIHVGDLLGNPQLGPLTGPYDTVILERVERGLYETDLAAITAALVR